MDAHTLVSALELIEMGKYAPDLRRVIRDERMNLVGALQDGDATTVARTRAASSRVLAMWLPNHPALAE